MKFTLKLIFGVILTLNVLPAKTGDVLKADESSLRNQLFSDVFLIRDGVDRMQINVEVLNKRYNSQMDILKNIQNKILSDTSDFEHEDDACGRITGLFNSTFRKLNTFESRIVGKLNDIQDEQTTRLDDIMKQRSGSCNFKTDSSGSVLGLTTTLTDISEKIDKFEEKLVKLETLESKFTLQQTQLDKFVETQLMVLQEINDKLTKNQQQINSFGQELSKIKELKANVNHIVSQPRRKLPMEVILGLSSANITSLK